MIVIRKSKMDLPELQRLHVRERTEEICKLHPGAKPHALEIELDQMLERLAIQQDRYNKRVQGAKINALKVEDAEGTELCDVRDKRGGKRGVLSPISQIVGKPDRQVPDRR